MSEQSIDQEQRARLIEAELILRESARRLAELAESAQSAHNPAILVTLAEEALERGLATIRGAQQADRDANEATSRGQESTARY
jgi:hypothetical protein